MKYEPKQNSLLHHLEMINILVGQGRQFHLSIPLPNPLPLDYCIQLWGATEIWDFKQKCKGIFSNLLFELPILLPPFYFSIPPIYGHRTAEREGMEKLSSSMSGIPVWGTNWEFSELWCCLVKEAGNLQGTKVLHTTTLQEAGTHCSTHSWLVGAIKRTLCSPICTVTYLAHNLLPLNLLLCLLIILSRRYLT